jgi:hypothetical protein
MCSMRCCCACCTCGGIDSVCMLARTTINSLALLTLPLPLPSNRVLASGGSTVQLSPGPYRRAGEHTRSLASPIAPSRISRPSTALHTPCQKTMCTLAVHWLAFLRVMSVDESERRGSGEGRAQPFTRHFLAHVRQSLTALAYCRAVTHCEWFLSSCLSAWPATV